jgi:hypothetical protein
MFCLASLLVLSQINHTSANFLVLEAEAGGGSALTPLATNRNRLIELEAEIRSTKTNWTREAKGCAIVGFAAGVPILGFGLLFVQALTLLGLPYAGFAIVITIVGSLFIGLGIAGTAAGVSGRQRALARLEFLKAEKALIEASKREQHPQKLPSPSVFNLTEIPTVVLASW